MKNMFILFTLAIVPLSGHAAPKKALIDFSCPVSGYNHTKDRMYKAMNLGSIWGREESNIMFVDESEELKDQTGNLTPIGKTFINADTKQLDIRGTFKIGYDYSAKECRRQIVLEKQVAPGIWEGHTAIEICSPDLKALITSLKKKSFDEIFAVLSDSAKKLQEQSEAISNAIYATGGVCDSTATNTNYDQTKCNEEQEKYSTLYDKASRLNSLEIKPEMANLVEYFKDEDGYILPRFKVKGNEYYFQRTLVPILDSNYTQTGESKACSLKVSHATSYAGLASSYSWDFAYDVALTSHVYTFDSNGVSVDGKTYKNEPTDYRFGDLKSYFFKAK